MREGGFKEIEKGPLGVGRQVVSNRHGQALLATSIDHTTPLQHPHDWAHRHQSAFLG